MATVHCCVGNLGSAEYPHCVLTACMPGTVNADSNAGFDSRESEPWGNEARSMTGTSLHQREQSPCCLVLSGVFCSFVFSTAYAGSTFSCQYSSTKTQRAQRQHGDCSADANSLAVTTLLSLPSGSDLRLFKSPAFESASSPGMHPLSLTQWITSLPRFPGHQQSAMVAILDNHYSSCPNVSHLPHGYQWRTPPLRGFPATFKEGFK